MNIVVLDWKPWANAQIDKVIVPSRKDLIYAGKHFIELVWILVRCGVKYPVMVDRRVGSWDSTLWVDVSEQEGRTDAYSVLLKVWDSTADALWFDGLNPFADRMVLWHATVEYRNANFRVDGTGIRQCDVFHGNPR